MQPNDFRRDVCRTLRGCFADVDEAREGSSNRTAAVMNRMSAAVTMLLVTGIVSIYDARASEVCLDLRGNQSAAQTAIWAQHREQQNVAIMAPIAGTWVDAVMPSEGSTGLLSATYLADGTMQVVVRECSNGICSVSNGAGHWAAYALENDDLIALARRFTVGSTRDYCDSSRLRFPDPQTAITPNGTVSRRRPSR